MELKLRLSKSRQVSKVGRFLTLWTRKVKVFHKYLRKWSYLSSTRWKSCSKYKELQRTSSWKTLRWEFDHFITLTMQCLRKGTLDSVLTLDIPHICHFFTQAKFFENKIYTKKRHFLPIFANLHRNLHQKTLIFSPIFCVESVKIYTGQKKFTRVTPVTNMRCDSRWSGIISDKHFSNKEETLGFDIWENTSYQGTRINGFKWFRFSVLLYPS